jgi:hypothetical protein
MTGAVPAKAFVGHATNQGNLAEWQLVDAVRPLQRCIKDAQQWPLLADSVPRRTAEPTRCCPSNFYVY